MRRDKFFGICDQWTSILAYVSSRSKIQGMVKSAWCRNVDNIYIHDIYKQEISLKKIFGGSQILTILTQLSDEIPLYSLSLHAGKGCSV